MCASRVSDVAALPGQRKRIAVVGLGPAGLATLRELQAHGHCVSGFEQQPRIGGVFASHYDSLQLTSNSLITSFSSFPSGTEDEPKMWTRREYLQYLDDFANHFGIMRRIYLSSRVVSLRWDEHGQVWRARAVPHGDGTPTQTSSPSASAGPLPADGAEFVFDHVAVCSGNHMLPRIPHWPGIESFGGRILHSSQVRGENDFAGRRVVVVGLGESGSDIALIAARAADATAISTRSGPGYVVQRLFNGRPTDLDTNRCYHGIPRWLSTFPQFRRIKLAIEDRYVGGNDDKNILRLAAEINRKRNMAPFNRFGTKNTSFIEAILYHGAEYRPDIARLEPNCVVFTDGARFECDTIVCCTGYAPDLSYLDVGPRRNFNGLPGRCLYKHMIDPELGSRIAWIGFVRPGFGSIPPLAELQARYFALLATGERKLPAPEQMQRDIEHHSRLDLMQYPADAQRIAVLTDYLRFMESIAAEIGCSPPLLRLFLTDLRLWAKVLFGPLCGAQYRLEGPGAEPNIAREVLMRAPTMPRSILAYEFAFLLGAKLLHTVTRHDAFKPLGF
ncbi:FAD-dependent oxidoreductase [Mycobacterium sp. ML4]